MQYGRPFIIVREQAKKTRTHGIEAIKVPQSNRILSFSNCIPLVAYPRCTNSSEHYPDITGTARYVSKHPHPHSTHSSAGLDKILISPDGEITVTNDGATILGQMEVEHQIAKLLVQLSKSQDDEIGDGTTGVVGA